jgi:bidirectional [NiFe] hydrogenase diaphorase subunit
VQLHDLLTKLVEGRGTAFDLAQMESLCQVVRHTSLCGLGMSAPNPIVSTLRYFPEEYQALLQPDRWRIPATVS